LTLIAKSLQTLSNLGTFGSKEPWMEPMNTFLNSHRQEFKTFVDSICGISHDRALSGIPPSYATPITILGRLPATSREGFPSLPYLIDQTREFAALVNLWISSKETKGMADASDEVKRFDGICETLTLRTKEYLNQAEQAERPSGIFEVKWEELVEQMDRKAGITARNPRSTPEPPSVPHRRLRIHGSRLQINTQSNPSLSPDPASASPNYSTSYSPRPWSPSVQNGLHHMRSSSDAAVSPLGGSLPQPHGQGPTPPGSSSGIWGPGTPAGAAASDDSSSAGASGLAADRDLPSHALHWTSPERSDGFGEDSGSSLRSLEVESGGVRAVRDGGSSSPRSPTSPRDPNGNRRVDIWRLKRKAGGLGGVGAKEGGQP
jgi:hypothetical protein